MKLLAINMSRCNGLMKIMIKLQTIVLLVIIIGELISQNHYSSYLHIFNKHFFNGGITKMKNTQ
jgi:hypothetical protein